MAENKIAGNFNCCGDKVVTLKKFVEEMGKIIEINPIIEFNQNADESEFPFANETFYCTNDKLKKLGIKIIPLIKGLKKDYEEYYESIV